MTPEQIDAYCKRLAEAWKKMPDVELAYLIDEATYEFEGHYSFADDEALITAIERMVDNGKE